jgi:hypothetical protein
MVTAHFKNFARENTLDRNIYINRKSCYEQRNNSECRAYSYIRFFCAAQATEDSSRRQVTWTGEFCQRHNHRPSAIHSEDLPPPVVK